jgi:glycosyltransferase involved in cell wall biosynthesis
VTDIWIIVPTYNEKENIGILVPMLLDLPILVGVIVVDDNSPDGTGVVADELEKLHNGRVCVIHRSGKLGLGTAYIAGFKRGFELNATWLLTMDADFSHHPRYIPGMIRMAQDGFDLVIGSRYVHGGDTPDFPFHRRLLSFGANTFARTMLGLKAHDATAGFRCYRREALSDLPLDEIFSSGYSFLIEMLFLFQQAHNKVGEVPISFEDRKHGESKISQREITRALYTVLRLAWRRIFGSDPRFMLQPGEFPQAGPDH